MCTRIVQVVLAGYTPGIRRTIARYLTCSRNATYFYLFIRVWLGLNQVALHAREEKKWKKKNYTDLNVRSHGYNID